MSRSIFILSVLVSNWFAFSQPPANAMQAQVSYNEADGAVMDEKTLIGKAKSTKQPCVIVDIAGDRAGHLDCAAQRLQEAARIAQHRTRSRFELSIPQAGSSDASVGVANETATRLRMGSALGRSVTSERPAVRPRAGRP